MRSEIRTALAALVLAACRTSEPAAPQPLPVPPPTPVPPRQVMVGPRVLPVYLAPSDEPQASTLARSGALDRQLAGIQDWLASAMGPASGYATFRYEPTRVVRSARSLRQWQDIMDRREGCWIYDESRRELLDYGALARIGLPPPSDEATYFVVAGARGFGGGCGAEHWASIEVDVLDRVATYCPNGRRDAWARACDAETCGQAVENDPERACAGTGAVAHELGHAFGLPHPEDRPSPDAGNCQASSIMHDWWGYDAGTEARTLCAADRSDLLASHFLGPSMGPLPALTWGSAPSIAPQMPSSPMPLDLDGMLRSLGIRLPP